MNSTGNDIVALKAINIARTKQQNFYRKIITGAEEALYHKQLSDILPFEQFVWLLWTVKESCYKYLQRMNHGLVFQPVKIEISLITPPSAGGTPPFEGRGFNDPTVYKGMAEFGPHILYSRSIITQEYIFSLVNQVNDFEQVLWGIKQIDSAQPADQSESVRSFAMAMLNSLFAGAKLEISKSAYGYPILLKNSAQIPLPISLAHHDHYVAYSFQV